MRAFDSDEWEACKGETVLPISARHMVDLSVSCTLPVEVFGLSEETEVPIKSGAEFTIRRPFRNFEALILRGKKEVFYGVRFRGRPMQEGEDNDGVPAPVVSLPEPSNLLLKMRQIARDHHAQNRYPVLEPEDLGLFTRYELDDEDEAMFEEELLERADQERKAAAKKAAEDKAAAEGRKEPEAKAGEAPPPPKEGSTPPPPAQAAE